ncbi:MAG: GNAT family N-acetyltransferase [Pyrinomonadaceae bacterium]
MVSVSIAQIVEPDRTQRSWPTSRAASELCESETDDALAFLAKRPLHNVILEGWLTDLKAGEKPTCGRFFKHRDENGLIDGIALIGKHTLLEAHRPAAIRAFAELARERGDIKMFCAESPAFEIFWRHYSLSARRPRLAMSLSFLTISEPLHPIDASVRLRPAEIDDLDAVVDAHAGLVRMETFIDPRIADADGFRERCLARIRRGDVWLWRDDRGRLVFKLDIASRTRQALYCEGLWVAPELRGQGLGRRGLEAFCRRVLDGSNSVCLFADSRDDKLQRFYLRSGFLLSGRYKKIYL